ncbi:MAG: NAD(P)H-quinone oxidoreductase [Gammaproteobacteria bacterium]
MKAVCVPPYGGPEVMDFRDVPEPVCAADDLLVRVRAIGVNRADCLQRAGNYPPPAGASNVLGLEICGDVLETGSDVIGFAPGDRIFGLVASGAYAERAVINYRHAAKLPSGWNAVQGASIVETFCTASETVFGLGNLDRGETILIHAGASGVGTAAVQMAKNVGATVLFTASTQEKIDKVLALGADFAINYRTHDFVEEVYRFTQGRGVDVIEDFIGADYLHRNLSALSHAGRLIMVGLMGSESCQFDPAIMLRKRLRILGFKLRSQPVALKQAIISRFTERWLPLLVNGELVAPVHAVYPFVDVIAAHTEMEANRNVGKIVLQLETFGGSALMQ